MKAVNTLKLLLAALVFICGCAKTDSNLIGVWSNVQTPETVEFRADKSGIFNVKDQPSLAFTWAIIDNNRVRIDISFQGNVRTLLGKVVDDSFILEGTGQRATYRKVKQ